MSVEYVMTMKQATTKNPSKLKHMRPCLPLVTYASYISYNDLNYLLMRYKPKAHFLICIKETTL